MSDVLAAIDGALRDYETGADAMRWVPPDSRKPEPVDPLAAYRQVFLDIQVNIAPFGASLRQLGEAMSRALRPLSELGEAMSRALRPLSELARKLAPAAQAISEERRSRLSSMHREYARRQRARRRRR